MTGCLPAERPLVAKLGGPGGCEGLPCAPKETRKQENYTPGLKVIRHVLLVHVPSGKIIIWEWKRKGQP